MTILNDGVNAGPGVAQAAAPTGASQPVGAPVRQPDRQVPPAPPAEEGTADPLVATLEGMTVQAVLAAVEAGHLDRRQVIQAERAGRNRSTLIEPLEG